MKPEPFFTYCVTCQCLTPIGELSDVTMSTGIHTEIVRADSEQQAQRIVKEGIAARFKEYGSVAIRNNNVGVLDEKGHIVNFFWSFRSHRV